MAARGIPEMRWVGFGMAGLLAILAILNRKTDEEKKAQETKERSGM